MQVNRRKDRNLWAHLCQVQYRQTYLSWTTEGWDSDSIINFYAENLFTEAPRSNLLHGSIMNWDESRFIMYLITFSKFPGKPKENSRLCQYDDAHKRVRRLAKKFNGMIIFLYNEEADVDRNKPLKGNPHVLFHVNDIMCQQCHLWADSGTPVTLAISRVACAAIEYFRLDLGFSSSVFWKPL